MILDPQDFLADLGIAVRILAFGPGPPCTDSVLVISPSPGGGFDGLAIADDVGIRDADFVELVADDDARDAARPLGAGSGQQVARVLIVEGRRPVRRG
jgi:hypothetical protein